ncbi:hypothetical protein KP509_38G034200 [Ceratopteris richardii]|nr:hypothetical protein KP509_38G034200 [Ceratopteris richardii]
MHVLSLLGKRNSRASFQYKSLGIDGLWIECWYNSFVNAPRLPNQIGLVHPCSRGISAFVLLLNDCSRKKDLCRGTKVHDEIEQSGLLEQCSDALVCMYARCGSLLKAINLFDRFRSKDVFTWTALIGGYANIGKGHKALSCFKRMRQEGISPSAATFVSILKACGDMRMLDKGEEIHNEILKHGLLKDNVVLNTALMGMYAKCGVLLKAQELLDKLPDPDVIAWNVLIMGYMDHGQFGQAWTCFERMQYEHVSPSVVTFACMLKICGNLKAADKGKHIHDEIIKLGLLGNNIVLGTALVDMYAKCGNFVKARQVLEELPVRDTISWTALIAGYSEYGKGLQALDCFEQMEYEGVSPNAVTFASVLKACGDTGEVAKGESIHDEVCKQHLLKDTVVGTALINMYCKFGALAKAQEVLKEFCVRDIIAWNALLSGYVDHGENAEGLDCFWQIQHERLSPNVVTFICALKACGNIGALVEGQSIHDQIRERDLLNSHTVLGTALVDMYAKCSALTKAAEVLKQLQNRDTMSWTALIAGYVEHGETTQAFECFEQMQEEGLIPNVVTLVCLLRATGRLGLSIWGEKIHDEISRQGLLAESVDLCIALVDMYAKCGALTKARQVLNELPLQNVSCWNALIAGYVQNGKFAEALIVFDEMKNEGLSPDEVTFVCVLSAYCRLGLMQEAQNCCLEMSTRFGLYPDSRQFTCMIDGFGRLGCLTQAVEMIEDLKFISRRDSFDSEVRPVLLGACQRWGDLNVGRWAFECTHHVKSVGAAA